MTGGAVGLLRPLMMADLAPAGPLEGQLPMPGSGRVAGQTGQTPVPRVGKAVGRDRIGRNDLGFVTGSAAIRL